MLALLGMNWPAKPKVASLIFWAEPPRTQRTSKETCPGTLVGVGDTALAKSWKSGTAMLGLDKACAAGAGWLAIADLSIGTVQNSPEGRMPGSKSEPAASGRPRRP